MEDNGIYQVKRKIVIKIEDNITYQKYVQTIIKDVPCEDMKILLDIFFDKAAINMGKDSYDAPEATKESILEYVYKEFGYLPVFYIGSGIIKGSLGQYGSGRLVPRTVYIWLNESSKEYNRYLTQEIQKEKNFKYSDSVDLHKYPLGSAIVKKIQWYKEGKLLDENWDCVNLKALTEAIGRKERIEFENFLNR